MEEECPSLQPRQSALKSVMISPAPILPAIRAMDRRDPFSSRQTAGRQFLSLQVTKVAALSRGFEAAVFDLYGDAERRTLLSTVTVSGGIRRNRIITRSTTLASACRSPRSFVCRALLELDGTRCGRNFRLSRPHRLALFTLREICCSASPSSFVWMAWCFIPACTPRFWRPILTRGEWQPLHEPKKIALHRVSKRCWFWAIREWRRDFLPWLPTNSALSMDSSL